MRRHHLPLAPEPLESRTTPSSLALAWPEPSRLSLSFASDGTDINGQSSVLFETLDALYRAEGQAAEEATDEWQEVVLHAFQSWTPYAPLNFHLVDEIDDPPFGTPGPVQGHHAMGDIRIGSRAMDLEALAIATPFDMLGSWSGDVVINSRANFNPHASEGSESYDLFSVLLHEAGNALGLADDPTQEHSALFPYYVGPIEAPTDSDIASLQQIYGARPEDVYETSGEDPALGNDFLSLATPLMFSGLEYALPEFEDAPELVEADLTSRVDPDFAADRDFYRFQTPSNLDDLDGMQIALKTSGISLLTARVSLLDTEGQLIHRVGSVDPRDGDLTIDLNTLDLDPDTQYIIRVTPARADVFGVGSYRLAVGQDASSLVNEEERLNQLTHDEDSDDGLIDSRNDSPGSAIELELTEEFANARSDGFIRARIDADDDRDFYVMTVPQPQDADDPDSAVVLSIVAWNETPAPSEDPEDSDDPFEPRIRIYEQLNGDYFSIDSETLYYDSGTVAIRSNPLTPGTELYLRVSSEVAPLSNGSDDTGQYFVGLDFHHTPDVIIPDIQVQLDASEHQAFHSRKVDRVQLVQFHLTANFDPTEIAFGLRLTVYKEQSQEVVETIVFHDGESGQFDLLLMPGSYAFRFAAGTRNSEDVLPNVEYTLTARDRSTPKGATLIDPIGAPNGPGDSDPPREGPKYFYSTLLENILWIKEDGKHGHPYLF